MSFYFAATFPQSVIVLADNRRRIFKKNGCIPFQKAIFLDDAKKIYRISSYVWMTGTGLREFHLVILNILKSAILESAVREKPAQGPLIEIAVKEAKMMENHSMLMEKTARFLKDCGGHPDALYEMNTEIVLAAVTNGDLPVLIRFSSQDRFQPETLSGPGKQLLPKSLALNATLESIGFKDRLEIAQRLVALAHPADLMEASLRQFPPLMDLAASLMPSGVSSCGDLLMIGPNGSHMALF